MTTTPLDWMRVHQVPRVGRAKTKSARKALSEKGIGSASVDVSTAMLGIAALCFGFTVAVQASAGLQGQVFGTQTVLSHGVLGNLTAGKLDAQLDVGLLHGDLNIDSFN
jgi:hypothetical protein